MLKKIGWGLLLIALSGAASAKDSCKSEHFWWFTSEDCKPVEHHHQGKAVAAPEFDRASAMSALTMIVGGLAVLRSRRKNSAA